MLKQFLRKLTLVLIIGFLTSPIFALPDSWPRTYDDKQGGHVMLYQPQFDQWNSFTTLDSIIVVAVLPAGEKTPVLGTVKLTATTDVDKEARQVHLSNIKITEINFPTLDPQLVPKYTQLVQNVLPTNPLTLSLDRVTANLQRTQAKLATIDLKNNPPPIYFSQSPAILVNTNGDVIWSPVLATHLSYAINTNWDLFKEENNNITTFYLRNGDYWLKTSDLKKPWQPAGELPSDFSNLPNSNNWKDTKANIPGKSIAENQVPKVFVSNVPAEMIVTNGAPQLVSITGTQLSWVSNTSSHLFYDADDSNYYFLVSGRWFKRGRDDANGSWAFATNDLPADFRKIPDDGPQADVLASIPGTPQAEQAVILANIPQKAKVKRTTTTTVSYAGSPQFEPITGTQDLSYATNTSSEVIAYNGAYYLVENGVWFVSNNPDGPWTPADSIPNAIYTIPPSSPLYNVTYVYAYGSDADWIDYGYTSGYLGAFIAGTAFGSLLAYGTGWYYPPYYFNGFYYPYAYTYGIGAFYNPWFGHYGRYGHYYGPYHGLGYEARYNPATHGYQRGFGAYGAYKPQGFIGAHNPSFHSYNTWGKNAVQPSKNWANAVKYDANNHSFQNAMAKGSLQIGKDNNLFGGKDGNIYRNTSEGWQKLDKSGWKNAEAPKELTNMPQKSLTSPAAHTNEFHEQQPVQRMEAPQHEQIQQQHIRKMETPQHEQIQQQHIQRIEAPPHEEVHRQLNRDATNRAMGERNFQYQQRVIRQAPSANEFRGIERFPSGGMGGMGGFSGGGFHGGGGGGFGGGGFHGGGRR